MFDKKIEEFILSTKDGIVFDHVNGLFVLENKSFVEGKNNSLDQKISATGATLEICIDNFLCAWEKVRKQESKKQDIDDIESYHWYSSY